MQRVYAVTFPDLKQVKNCMKRMEQPKKQNNTRLGTQQKLLVMIIQLSVCCSSLVSAQTRAAPVNSAAIIYLGALCRECME